LHFGLFALVEQEHETEVAVTPVIVPNVEQEKVDDKELCWFSGNWTKPVYHKRQAIPSGDYFDEFF